MRSVVHYGLCSLAYSSYVLLGLEELAADGVIDLSVSRRVPGDLRAVCAGHPHMQMTPVFDAVDVGGAGRVRFCVDNHDKPDVVQTGLLESVDHYFKLNHDPEVLDRLDLGPADRKKIASFGAPIFPLRLDPWRHRPRFRPVDDLAWGFRDALRRVRHLQRLTRFDELIELRSSPKTVDVVFVNRIYSQPNHKPINDFRYEVGHRLATHADINAVVGFIGPGVSGKFERYAMTEDRPEDHVRQLASSRIGVYVWGTHRCLSFKFGELLGLGVPVVGQTIPQDREHFASLGRLDEQFAHDDPQELVDAVTATLGDEALMRELARSNREVFDETLAPRPSAQRIVDHVFNLDR